MTHYTGCRESVHYLWIQTNNKNCMCDNVLTKNKFDEIDFVFGTKEGVTNLKLKGKKIIFRLHTFFMWKYNMLNKFPPACITLGFLQ